MNDAQVRMNSTLRSIIKQGKERGVQLVACLNGEQVIDTWAGVTDARDATSKTLVDGDTLFPVFSVTKALVATIIHQLVQRGKLEYDTHIADIWPEFAANGKGGITVRHALSHTSGIPLMPLGIGRRELGDWDVMCRAIANLKPETPPGAVQAYHAVTFGWILGEVACRIEQKTFGELVERDLCAPLGITSMFVGLPPSLDSRVATLNEIWDPGAEPKLPDDSLPAVVPNWMMPLHELMNGPEGRRACAPASNGIMNARSIARFYAAHLPGGVDGVELLPPSRVREASQFHPPAAHPSQAGPIAPIGLGYFLGGEGFEMGSRKSAFGHGGYGGSLGYADPEVGLAVGFTKNFFSKDGATREILHALRDCLGVPQ